MGNGHNVRATVVRTATGTDTVPLWNEKIQLEMDAFVKAGQTPLEGIRAATIHAATCICVQHELGSVEVRKLADLILVEYDPVTEIRDMNKIVWVIQGEKRYTRQDILANIHELVSH
jgi:imidazolonepropionase-like amidohydrolase